MYIYILYYIYIVTSSYNNHTLYTIYQKKHLSNSLPLQTRGGGGFLASSVSMFGCGKPQRDTKQLDAVDAWKLCKTSIPIPTNTV